MARLQWILHQDEGQFFERKSCYDRSGNRVRGRNVRDVAEEVAETLSAMANADGGSIVLGIEDDGSVTGADYPEDRLQVLNDAPKTRVRPPLRTRRQSGNIEGRPVLLYEVDWSPDVHQLTDGRYLLRIGDDNVPFPAEDIEAIKEGKRRRVAEVRFIPQATLEDLDSELIREFADKVGLSGEAEDVLVRYRLADRRNGRIVLTLAALLLFSRDPGRWHPRCGISFVKYDGTDRRGGAELNVIKRDRLEAPLLRLIADAYDAIRPQLRTRQQLVDLFFEEQLEYPQFAWQEAVVNAVAHRDYSYEGLGIEVCMFDDRLEVRSPGQLVEPVTIERLRMRERVHASRNPRIVRVLTDHGYMRELGEGIPRMFEAMEREGLYPPDFRLEADSMFTVTLKNMPIYHAETMRWLSRLEGLGLSGNQKRLLAYAREHDNVFTSRAYQDLADIDLYTASRDIKDLIRKGVVQLPRKGGRAYRLTPVAGRVAEKPAEYALLEPLLRSRGFVTNRDIRDKLGVSRPQASRIARRLVAAGWLCPQGEKRGRRYVLAK